MLIVSPQEEDRVVETESNREDTTINVPNTADVYP